LLEILLLACNTFSTGDLPESFRSKACFVEPLQVVVVQTHRKENSLLDSLEWSKRYEVLSFSRLTLSSRGFTNEQITSLTDADLEHIADVLQTLYPDFEESVQFITALRLAEKRKDNS